jgi:FixJ family two-component response regulator
MENEKLTVFIVDDDLSIRRALKRLFISEGYDTLSFHSAREFLDAGVSIDHPCCLVLDIKMPDMDGLDLQSELLTQDYSMPIVFITGHGDVPSSVNAMKGGAVDFLLKPVEDEVLLNVVRKALNKDRNMRTDLKERAGIDRRLKSLTPRELEVLRYVISGLLNKQIAYELGIGEKTVKVHRGRVMSKMEVDSVAELTRLSLKAGLQPAVIHHR